MLRASFRCKGMFSIHLIPLHERKSLVSHSFQLIGTRRITQGQTSQLTSLDRIFSIKPALTRDPEDIDDKYDGIPSEYDHESIGDDDSDPPVKLGKKLLKFAKVHYRHIEYLPTWVQAKVQRICDFRSPAQIRRNLRSWMITNDRDDQTTYKNRKIGWRNAIPDKIPKIISYGPEETVAYGNYFLPARFAVTRRVLDEVKMLLPNFKPRRVLDFGCGPGTGFAVIRDVWDDPIVVPRSDIPPSFHPKGENRDKKFEKSKDSREAKPFSVPPSATSSTPPSSSGSYLKSPSVMKKYVGIDISQSMIDAAKMMTEGHGIDCVFWNKTAEVVQAAQERNQRYDLILCSYTLSEFGADVSRQAACQLLFELLDEGGVLVIVENGNPAGSHTVRTARQFLLNFFKEDVNSTMPDPLETLNNISDKNGRHGKNEFEEFQEDEEGNMAMAMKKKTTKIKIGNDTVEFEPDDSVAEKIRKLTAHSRRPPVITQLKYALPPPVGRDDHKQLQATVISPCTHDKPCPLGAGLWCSFAQKVRSGMIRQGAMEKFSYVAMRKVPRPGFEKDSVVPSSYSDSITSPYPVNRRLSKTVSFNKEKSSKNSKSKIASNTPSADSSSKQPLDNWTLSEAFLADNGSSTKKNFTPTSRDPTPLSVIHQFLAITQPSTLAESQVQRQEDQGNARFDESRVSFGEEEEEDFAELSTNKRAGQQKSYYDSIGHVNSLIKDEEDENGDANSNDEDEDDDDDDDDDEEGDEEDEEDDDEEDDDMTDEERIRFGRQERSKKVKELVNKLVDQTDWEVYDPPLYKNEWTRVIRTPIKGRGHITLDLCHPSATVVRHTVARSEIKAIPSLYTALRKTTWGGIFPAMQAPTVDNVLSSTTVVTKSNKSWKRKPVHEHVRRRDMDEYDDDENYFDDGDEDEREDDEEVPVAKDVKFNKALNNQQMYIGRSARSSMTEIDRRTDSAIKREDKLDDRRREKVEKKYSAKKSRNSEGEDDDSDDNYFGGYDDDDDDDGEDNVDDEEHYDEPSRSNKGKGKSVVIKRNASAKSSARQIMPDGEFSQVTELKIWKSKNNREIILNGDDNDDNGNDENDDEDVYESRPRRRGMPKRVPRRR